MNAPATHGSVRQLDTRRIGDRVGYIIAILINVVLMLLINLTPGWQTLPFLTDSFGEVLPLLNASLVANLLANVAFCFYDSRRFKAAVNVPLMAIAFAVTWQLLRVFPFDFAAYSFNWALVARSLLFLGCFGALVGLLTNLVQAVKSDTKSANKGLTAGR